MDITFAGLVDRGDYSCGVFACYSQQNVCNTTLEETGVYVGYVA